MKFNSFLINIPIIKVLFQVHLFSLIRTILLTIVFFKIKKKKALKSEIVKVYNPGVLLVI